MKSESKDKDKLTENSVEKALGSINQQLRERLKNVEEREEALLENAVEAFRQEKSKYGCENEPGDVLHLNVGGTHMAVLRRTMTSIEGSMLASKFSGRWDDNAEKDREGNFFIDQPIELFKPMVDYLRARSIETPRAPPLRSPVFHKANGTEDTPLTQDFWRLLEYYGMTNGVYPMEVKLHCGESGDSSIIPNSTGFEVHSNAWSTFTLVSRGHNRKVKAFEVVLGDVERVQIGWINPICWAESPGTGQTNCSHFGFRVNGGFTSVGGVSTGEGSVIRCENQGSGWFVDGEPLQHSIGRDPNKFVPAISGKAPGESLLSSLKALET